MTRAIFLSHCGVRDVRHTSSLTRDLILLITRLKENCAPRAHTAPTARQRDEPRTKCVGHATPTSRFSSASQALATRLKTDKFSILRVILKHTTRLRIHTLTHAWNILISSALTEWESRDCLTAIHMKPFSSSVFTNSRRDVSSSSWTAQIVRQGISVLKLVEHLCLLGSTNTSLINQDWSHIHACPLGLTWLDSERQAALELQIRLNRLPRVVDGFISTNAVNGTLYLPILTGTRMQQ